MGIISCIAQLCFISEIYITGELGIVYFPEEKMLYSYYERSNHFGTRAAEAAITIEFNNNMYLKASHISGVDTAEPFDYGLNRISIGGKFNLFTHKDK